MSRHAGSGIYYLRPDHGVTFLDIEISAAELGHLKSCFVEERVVHDGAERAVLLPVASENMFDDGTAWHPESLEPLGPGEALWLDGLQGIRPLLGTWLPLPYLRVTSATSTGRPGLDHGPLNWVRIFIEPSDAPPGETTSYKAVLAIDTALDGDSRLDQRRYNAPSREDVMLGSSFVLTDDPDHLAGLLGEAWLNEWLQVALEGGRGRLGLAASRFKQEHVARYLFLLTVLCKACPAPILRFASRSRERLAIDAVDSDLIMDLSEDVGLAVVTPSPSDTRLSRHARSSRILPVRDLARPSTVFDGHVPVRVEFDGAPFGLAAVSRRSGRSEAFKWASLVRVGEQATRLALRANASRGVTGSAALARHAWHDTPVAGIWRCSSEDENRHGPPARARAMRHLSEDGSLIDSNESGALPALRAHFSRASLLTFFIAEIVMHAIAVLNAPRRAGSAVAAAENLATLRLSLPVSMPPAEREAILARARAAIDFVWRAQGWEHGQAAFAPEKPGVEIGLGGDFGVQLLALHDELNDVYGGDLPALLDDLALEQRATDLPSLQLASFTLGQASARLVVARYKVVDGGNLRPRLETMSTYHRGIDAIHAAVVEHMLLPAVSKALHREIPSLTDTEFQQHFGSVGDGSEQHSAIRVDIRRDLADKIFHPAARALLEIYEGSVPGSVRGLEYRSIGALVKQGGGRIEAISQRVAERASELGAANFNIADVRVPFSHHAFRGLVRDRLATILAHLLEDVEAGSINLLIVTSAFQVTEDVRDLVLAALPIGAHRLIMLDRGWAAKHGGIDLPRDLAAPLRAGIFSTAIGKQRMLDLDGIGLKSELTSGVA